jgi:ATP-dependent helicase/nuclease subunit B
MPTMPVTFVIGRAGTGKTRYCLDALLRELDTPDALHPLILLVPEQASFQMERALALASPRGGFWRAEVLTFSRLASRVLERVGSRRVVIRPAARRLALRALGSAEDEQPAALRDAMRTPGFYALLDRLLEELLRESVTPEALRSAAASLTDAAQRARLVSLASTYRAYLDWLGPDRADPAQSLADVAERVAAGDLLAGARVWVDGFAGFTALELELLTALAQRAAHVFVTLLLDDEAARSAGVEHDPLDIFRRTRATHEQLCARLGRAGVTMDNAVRLAAHPARRFVAADLARLETALAARPAPAPGAAGGTAGGGVRIVACATHHEELLQAARFIRVQIVRSNGALRFRDFAIIARDLSPLADLAAHVLQECEIPHFLDRRRSLRAHVLPRFVGALLEAARADLPVTAMQALLRSGLLPVSREVAERLDSDLERYRATGIELWRRASWSGFADKRAGSRGEMGEESPNVVAARHRLAALLAPLSRLAHEGVSPTGAVWARALYDSLCALGVPKRIEEWAAEARSRGAWESAELHRLAWERLIEMLEDMHEVLGGSPLSAPQFAYLVTSALADETIGLAPPTLDQVLVGSIERSRHPDIKYAWVIGLNAGLFPKPAADEPLLSARERDELIRLGLPETLSRADTACDERLLAYIALTRPSHGLTLSYARVGLDEQPLHPSPLLHEVRGWLPHVAVTHADDRPGPPGGWFDAARGVLAASDDDPVMLRRYRRLEQALAAEPSGARIGHLLRGRTHRNETVRVGCYRSAPAEAGDAVWVTSPSELECRLRCPFQHFARYGLRLDAQRGPTPAAIRLGSCAHRVMAGVTRRAIASGRPAQDVDDATWLSWLDEARREELENEPADLERRCPPQAFQTRLLLRRLRDLVLAHGHRYRRGLAQPLSAERAFGLSEADALPPAPVELNDGKRAWLTGRIDRIDVVRHDGAEYLVVYDYKSKVFIPGKREVFRANDLQLLCYLHALLAGLGPAQRLGGMFIAPLYSDREVLKTKYAAAADEGMRRMYTFQPRGVIDEDIADAFAGRLESVRSPVMMTRRNADGSLAARGDTCRSVELTARVGVVRDVLTRSAEGVRLGDVAAAPLLEGRTLACATCDFRRVCRFELCFNRPRRAEDELPRAVLAPSEGKEETE